MEDLAGLEEEEKKREEEKPEKESSKSIEKLVEVTPETTISLVLKIPRSREILAEYRVPCIAGCPYLQFELDKLKIGDAAKTYGLDLDGMLEELNKSLGDYKRRI